MQKTTETEIVSDFPLNKIVNVFRSLKKTRALNFWLLKIYRSVDDVVDAFWKSYRYLWRREWYFWCRAISSQISSLLVMSLLLSSLSSLLVGVVWSLTLWNFRLPINRAVLQEARPHRVQRVASKLGFLAFGTARRVYIQQEAGEKTEKILSIFFIIHVTLRKYLTYLLLSKGSIASFYKKWLITPLL